MLLNLEKGPVQLQRLMTEAPATVAAALGGLALLLAAVGIYGVVAFLVNQRKREIGIRMALGASAWDVMAAVMRQTLKPVAWAIPFGLAGACVLSKLLATLVVSPETPDLLYGVSPWSPTTFLGVLAFLAVIVIIASGIPASAAARVDPMIALRYE